MMTYDILIALGKEAQFLYSTVDNYTSDAEKENKSDLVDMWNTIKQDRTRHLQMLREALARSKTREVDVVDITTKDLNFIALGLGHNLYQKVS